MTEQMDGWINNKLRNKQLPQRILGNSTLTFHPLVQGMVCSAELLKTCDCFSLCFLLILTYNNSIALLTPHCNLFQSHLLHYQYLRFFVQIKLQQPCFAGSFIIICKYLKSQWIYGLGPNCKTYISLIHSHTHQESELRTHYLKKNRVWPGSTNRKQNKGAPSLKLTWEDHVFDLFK